jgi:hypothetical protein
MPVSFRFRYSRLADSVTSYSEPIAVLKVELRFWGTSLTVGLARSRERSMSTGLTELARYCYWPRLIRLVRHYGNCRSSLIL